MRPVKLRRLLDTHVDAALLKELIEAAQRKELAEKELKEAKGRARSVRELNQGENGIVLRTDGSGVGLKEEKESLYSWLEAQRTAGPTACQRHARWAHTDTSHAELTNTQYPDARARVPPPRGRAPLADQPGPPPTLATPPCMWAPLHVCGLPTMYGFPTCLWNRLVYFPFRPID